jgi:hypothetical protein
LNGEPVNEDMEIVSNFDIYIEKTPNEYLLIFMNGSETISENLVKFGEVINYPSMENKTEEGVEYVFVWEDSFYNGKTMPARDLIIVGNYQEKAEAPIYFGSFVIPRSGYSVDNLSEYVSESDVDTNFYKTTSVAECVDVEKLLEFIYPVYEPFIGLTGRNLGKEKAKYYEPLTLVLPKTVVDGYNIEFNEASTGIDCWADMETNNTVITLKGNEYVVFAMAGDGTVPDNKEMLYEYKIKLTKK